MSGTKQPSPLRTVLTSDPTLNLVQAQTQAALQSLPSYFTKGSLVLNQVLTAGQDNVINHGLGRTPQLWVLTDINANSAVWRTAWTKTTITLHCGANCTASIWVA